MLQRQQINLLIGNFMSTPLMHSLALTAVLALAFSCTPRILIGPTGNPAPSASPGVSPSANPSGNPVQIANPASVYCTQNNGRLEIRQDGFGNQAGYCVFGDRSQCEEWAYYRGQCKPGDSLP